MTSRMLTSVALAAALGGTTVMAQRGPAAAATNLPAAVIALACAPRAASGPPQTPLRIAGGQDSFAHRAHAPGDLVTINAGSRNGITIGQEFYTRRFLAPLPDAASGTPDTAITTSWIRVYSVDDTMALATITHACETVDIGDHLEPFTLPAMPAVASDKPKPQRDNYGHVIAGDARRKIFAEGDFLVLDRGSDHGVAPGGQFVLYRDKQEAGNFLYELGEAVAVAVTPGTSTLLVTASRDAIIQGDLVAIRGNWKTASAEGNKSEDSRAASLPPLVR